MVSPSHISHAQECDYDTSVWMFMFHVQVRLEQRGVINNKDRCNIVSISFSWRIKNHFKQLMHYTALLDTPLLSDQAWLCRMTTSETFFMVSVKYLFLIKSLSNLLLTFQKWPEKDVDWLLKTAFFFYPIEIKIRIALRSLFTEAKLCSVTFIPLQTDDGGYLRQLIKYFEKCTIKLVMRIR